MKKLALATLIVLFSSGALAKIKVDNVYLLSPGMNKQEVMEVIGGRPNTTEFVGTLEEWHYCTPTLISTPSFVAVYFIDGELYAMKEYRAKGPGGCENGIKQGTYREPDFVQEYRVKYR